MSDDSNVRAPTLEGFAEAVKGVEGVDLKDLILPVRIIIKTLNSTYEVLIINPAAGGVVVRGGEYFPTWTFCVLSGSSIDGWTFLKMHWIGIGFRMEFFRGGQPRVVTSPVQSFEICEWQDGHIH